LFVSFFLTKEEPTNLENWFFEIPKRPKDFGKEILLFSPKKKIIYT
jgi:hypothetical protein